MSSGNACAIGLITALAAGLSCAAVARGLPGGRARGLLALAACFPVLLAVPTAYAVGRIVFS